VLIGGIAVAGALAVPTAVAEFPANWPWVAQGAILVGIGGWLVWRGIRGLGPSLTALPRPRDDATLVQEGVYGRIRHPIYAGVMALGLGWALASGSLVALLAALALVVVLDLKARREEVWLAERYPDYGAYRARTRRFVPGVY
jgi:protein-S-isoprenylcysteine O-methyltransferase Ste14